MNTFDTQQQATYLIAEQDAQKRAQWYQTQRYDITLLRFFKDQVDAIKTEDHQRALVAGQRAYEAGAFLDQEAQALGHWTYALALVSSGEYKTALHHFEGASKRYEQLGRTIEVAKVSTRQIQVLATLGRHQAALELAKHSREVFLAHNLDLELAQLEINTGIILSIVGQTEASKEALLRALPLMQKSGDQAGVASTYLNLGYSHQGQDQFSQAEYYFQRALGLFEEQQQTRSVAGTKVNIALLYRRQGRLAEALKVLSECHELYAALKDDPDAALADLELARVSLALNLLTEAEQLAEDLIATFSQRVMLVELNESREVLAQCMLRSGRYEKAFALWYEIEATWRSIDNHVQADQAQLVLLHLKADADATNTTSIDEIKALIQRIESHDTPLSLAYAMCLLAGQQMIKGDFAEAKQALDAATAMSEALHVTGLDAFITWHLGKLAAYQQEFNLAEQHYLQALQAYQEQQQHLPDDILKASFDNDKKALHHDYLSLLMDAGQIEKAFVFSDHHKARLLLELISSDRERALSALPSIEALQSQLAPQALFLEYLVVKQKIHVFVISASSFQCYALGDLTAVEEHLAQFHFFSQRIIQGGMYYQVYSYEKLQERILLHLHQLYQALLAPIEQIASASQLIIVPHAALHRLPFAALFDGSHYLIDRMAISITPNSTLYLRKDAKTQTAFTISAFGPSLDDALGIAEEMQVIQKHLPTASIFMNEAATIASFLKQCQQSQILHIATHGAFRNDNPMFSGFHLSDGWIRLQDMYQHNLKADLVILASCESALSKDLGIDEQFSLTRGFLIAGAASVLATLWHLHGQVSVRFIDHFYGFMSQGDSLVKALQQAQLALREEYPEAYYWAAFCLVGRPDYQLSPEQASHMQTP